MHVSIGQGMATPPWRQVMFASDLLGTLERQELADAVRAITAETGSSHRSIEDGERISGVYQRRLALASGRFALIMNEVSREFSLVPWRPEVERALGQAVSGTIRGRAVHWSLGRERGVEIG
jgi:hypothetical protein